MRKSGALRGISGWLILVAFGVSLTPLLSLITLLTVYVPLFTEGTWTALTSPSSATYLPYASLVLSLELIFALAMLGLSLVQLFLFFSKSRLFPRVFIAYLLITLASIPLDAWLAMLILPDEPFLGPEEISTMARTGLTSCIWIPYMLVSKRVKATFLAGPGDEGALLLDESAAV